MFSNNTQTTDIHGLAKATSRTRAASRIASCLLALSMTFAASVGSAAQFIEELTNQDFVNLGYVDQQNSLLYDHTFNPLESVARINRVQLGILVTDDFSCIRYSQCLNDWNYEREIASLSLDDQVWETGSATTRMFFADVTTLADLTTIGDTLSIVIESIQGDFNVWKSFLIVDYDVASGGSGASLPVPSVPEPSAALCFMIGGAIVSARLRRRRLA